jgi:DNA-binding transcriptional LysR family regulator
VHQLYKANKNKSNINRIIISENAIEDLILLEHIKDKVPVIKVLSWEVIAMMIKEGLGAGMLPDYVAQRHKFIPVAINQLPQIPFKIICISSKQKQLFSQCKFTHRNHAKLTPCAPFKRNN